MIPASYVGADGAEVRGDAALTLVRPDPREADGVLSVLPERWQIAQEYERATWMERCLRARDDRAADHSRALDRYRAIHGRQYRRAVELGCGAFTIAAALLAHGVEIDELELVDPLIAAYQSHPHCTHTRLARGRRVVVTPGTAEAWNGTPAALVIAVNVIEHCQDYRRALDGVLNACSRGATLVIGVTAVARAALDDVCARRWDAGHPLIVADDRARADLEAIGRPLFSRENRGLYEQPWRVDLYSIREVS